MKRKKKGWKSQFQADLVKVAKDLLAIRQGLGGLWLYRDSEMESPFSMEFRGAITKAIDRIDDAMRPLIEAEKIMVVAVRDRTAESLGMGELVKAMQERKRLPGEEPPSEKPSDLNKGENA
jgi:hypothetical protein